MNAQADSEVLDVLDVSAPRAAEAAENPVHLPASHAGQLDEIQKAVEALLEHTVEKAEFDIKDDFLKRVVPLLRKGREDFSEEDEICLWSAYNQLSKLAYPVTVESLAIAGEIHHTGLEVWGRRRGGKDKDGIFMTIEKCRRELRNTLWMTLALVLLFFFVQGYAIVVGEAVKTIKAVATDYEAVRQKIEDMHLANKDLAPDNSVLKQLENKKLAIERQSAGVRYLPVLFVRDCASFGEFDANLHCIDAVARFNLLVLSTHILPFVLGFLGAMAALARHSLNSLENKSFTQGWGGRWFLRLVLGGLLGEISGVMLTPSLSELEALKLSLVFVAFLMGYSTDFAFTVIDRAIATAKEAFKPGLKSSQTLAGPKEEPGRPG